MRAKQPDVRRGYVRRRFVVLLRAISNLPMQPFRQALEELGFADVISFGMSGNLLFNAEGKASAELERLIGEKLGVKAIVRTRAGMSRAVSRDPYRERKGACVLFLSRPVSASRKRAFENLDFAPEQPILDGRSVYYVYPVRLRGRSNPVDVERLLGVRGTIRASHVAKRLLELM